MDKNDLFKEGDLIVDYSRSGGPGGQNVNKRDTAVRIKIKIDDLILLEKEKKDIVDNIAPSHTTKNGYIMVNNSEERSRERNKEKAINILKGIILKSLKDADKERKAEKHKERVNKPKKGGGGTRNIKEHEKRKLRQERTEDLIKEAIEENPNLKDRLSN